jgi:nicotinamide mononucleotide transporter
LYSDLILHCIYIVLQIYGWYHWLHGGGENNALRASRMSLLLSALWALAALAGASGWGFLMASYTDAALPYPDAFIISTSLIAQWLMAQKKIENWIFWIAVDIVAIGVYFLKGLYVTTGLYFVFLLLCILGFSEWRKSLEATDDNTSDRRFAAASNP